jgi:hypothetical protein
MTSVKLTPAQEQLLRKAAKDPPFTSVYAVAEYKPVVKLLSMGLLTPQLNEKGVPRTNLWVITELGKKWVADRTDKKASKA